MKIRFIIFLVALLLFAWKVQAKPSTSCLTATGNAAVTDCRQELLQNPNNLEIRLALGEAYMTLKQYDDAVDVLRPGIILFPGNEAIKKKMRLAQSFAKEEQWIQRQKEKNEKTAPKKQNAIQLRLALIRCDKLKGDRALAACNAGLKIAPGHPKLLAGRANAWVEMGRYANAARDYKAVLAMEPENREVSEKLRIAQAKIPIVPPQKVQETSPPKKSISKPEQIIKKEKPVPKSEKIVASAIEKKIPAKKVEVEKEVTSVELPKKERLKAVKHKDPILTKKAVAEPVTFSNAPESSGATH